MTGNKELKQGCRTLGWYARRNPHFQVTIAQKEWWFWDISWTLSFTKFTWRLHEIHMCVYAHTHTHTHACTHTHAHPNPHELTHTFHWSDFIDNVWFEMSVSIGESLEFKKERERPGLRMIYNCATESSVSSLALTAVSSSSQRDMWTNNSHPIPSEHSKPGVTSLCSSWWLSQATFPGHLGEVGSARQVTFGAQGHCCVGFSDLLLRCPIRSWQHFLISFSIICFSGKKENMFSF